MKIIIIHLFYKKRWANILPSKLVVSGLMKPKTCIQSKSIFLCDATAHQNAMALIRIERATNLTCGRKRQSFLFHIMQWWKAFYLQVANGWRGTRDWMRSGMNPPSLLPVSIIPIIYLTVTRSSVLSFPHFGPPKGDDYFLFVYLLPFIAPAWNKKRRKHALERTTTLKNN